MCFFCIQNSIVRIRITSTPGITHTEINSHMVLWKIRVFYTVSICFIKSQYKRILAGTLHNGTVKFQCSHPDTNAMVFRHDRYRDNLYTIL